GTHLGACLPLEGDAALLRRVEAVDDVEHRGLAGAVRADDGADLALADVERDVGDRLHAAEGERGALDREQRFASRDLAASRGPHGRPVIPGRADRRSASSPESITPALSD